MKKVLISIGTFILVIILSFFAIANYFYPDNIAETSPDGGEKGLKTRLYIADVEQARKTVQDVIPTLSTYGRSWRIANDKTQTDSVIQVEVPVLFFTDDLTVKIEETKYRGEVQIDVRSQSRVGKSDFGENARHVRKLLNALDEKFEGK